MTKAVTAYKSPLHQMTQTTSTCLWNDSASLQELGYSIGHGAVGATCNPVIVVDVLKKEMHLWKERIQELMRAMPTATEHDIAWKVVDEMSIKGAELLKPIFDAHKGKNGRLSVQTDPRYYRDADAIVRQAVHLSQLAPNIIVKIPVTPPESRRSRKRRIAASASTPPCVFRCRNVLRWRRRWNAASRGGNRKGKTSRRWAPCARSWSAGWTTG